MAIVVTVYRKSKQDPWWWSQCGPKHVGFNLWILERSKHN